MTSNGRPFKRSDPTDSARESAAEVRAAETLFEAIVEIAEDAIIAVDSNQCIILYNRGAEKIFGHMQEEVIDKPLAVLLPQWSADTYPSQFEEFRESPSAPGVIGHRRELYGLRKDGSEFPAEASVTRFRDHHSAVRVTHENNRPILGSQRSFGYCHIVR